MKGVGCSYYTSTTLPCCALSFACRRAFAWLVVIPTLGLEVETHLDFQIFCNKWNTSPSAFLGETPGTNNTESKPSIGNKQRSLSYRHVMCGRFVCCLPCPAIHLCGLPPRINDQHSTAVAPALASFELSCSYALYSSLFVESGGVIGLSAHRHLSFSY